MSCCSSCILLAGSILAYRHDDSGRESQVTQGLGTEILRPTELTELLSQPELLSLTELSEALRLTELTELQRIEWLAGK